jgi:DNA invertase Pin-like site-specific DNA recombinase
MMDSQHLFIYSRKSRALGDPDDPRLLDAHREALLDLARRRSVTVPPANIRLEIGSGETIAERPTFQATLREWEDLPADAGGAVLVTMIDRLSRGDHADQGRIQKALSRADIKVWTPGREYDLRDVNEGFFFDVEALFARRELSLFKQRMTMGREKLVRDGRSPNLVPPYPYVVDRLAKEWAPHPDRFAMVQHWCHEVERDSLQVIADRWGVPYHVVWWTLRNPAIAGWPCKRSHLTADRKRWRESDPDEWVWPERQGSYPAVCSLDEWRRIQAIIDRRRVERSKRGGRENGWCRDVLRFVGHEDTLPRLSVQNAGNDHGPARARLPTYEIVTATGHRLYIAREVVHTAALDALTALFRRPEKVGRLADDYAAQRALEAREPRQEADRAETEKKLSMVRRKLVRIEDELLGSDDPERLLALTTLRDQTAGQAQALARQLQARPDLLPANDAMDQLLPALAAIIPNLPRHLQASAEEGDTEMLYLLTTAFLARIWVDVVRLGEKARYRREVVAVEERW